MSGQLMRILLPSGGGRDRVRRQAIAESHDSHHGSAKSGTATTMVANDEVARKEQAGGSSIQPEVYAKAPTVHQGDPKAPAETKTTTSTTRAPAEAIDEKRVTAEAERSEPARHLAGSAPTVSRVALHSATGHNDKPASGRLERKSGQAERASEVRPILGRSLEQEAHMGRVAYGINQQQQQAHFRRAAIGQELNPIMLIGVPVLGCLLLILVAIYLLKYCQRLKEKCREKFAGLQAAPAARPKSSRPTFISFISNGKLFSSGKGACQKATAGVESAVRQCGTGRKFCSSQRQKQSAFADHHQLTINMEADDELGVGQSGASTGDDSDDPQMTGVPSSKHAANSYGRLKYTLSYDFGLMELTVGLVEARDLPPMDLTGYSDPYVKLQLVDNESMLARPGSGRAELVKPAPSKPMRFCTKIHKRTLNPVFNEQFKVKIPHDELAQKRLIFAMFDYDRLSRHDEMGGASLSLHSIDLARDHENWLELGRMERGQAAPEEPLGDICLSLRYVPTAGKLNVVVLEARQLKKMDLGGLSDPYVKLALMSKGKRLKKKKTSIKKCTLNPHYNESFSFEIPFELVQEVQLVVTVVDYDRIGTSEPIGKVTLGCQQTSGESELRHWLDMLASPRRPIAQWHRLKDMSFQPSPPSPNDGNRAR